MKKLSSENIVVIVIFLAASVLLVSLFAISMINMEKVADEDAKVICEKMNMDLLSRLGTKITCYNSITDEIREVRG